MGGAVATLPAPLASTGTCGRKTSGSALGTASIAVQSGATLSGTGSHAGAATFASGGIVSPGVSAGAATLTLGAATFQGSSVYNFDLRDAAGTAGTGWDLLQVSGALNLTATDVSPFRINVTSLTTGDVAGPASNFNASDIRLWTLVNATGGISGFNPDAFQIDLTGFANTHDGLWSVAQVGDSLMLSYAGFTPVPEPAEWAVLSGIGLAGWALHRRRRGR